MRVYRNQKGRLLRLEHELDAPWPYYIWTAAILNTIGLSLVAVMSDVEGVAQAGMEAAAIWAAFTALGIIAAGMHLRWWAQQEIDMASVKRLVAVLLDMRGNDIDVRRIARVDGTITNGDLRSWCLASTTVLEESAQRQARSALRRERECAQAALEQELAFVRQQHTRC